MCQFSSTTYNLSKYEGTEPSAQETDQFIQNHRRKGRGVWVGQVWGRELQMVLSDGFFFLSGIGSNRLRGWMREEVLRFKESRESAK